MGLSHDEWEPPAARETWQRLFKDQIMSSSSLSGHICCLQGFALCLRTGRHSSSRIAGCGLQSHRLLQPRRGTSKLPSDLQGSLESWLDDPHFSTGIQTKRVQTENSLDATLDNLTALARKLYKLVTSDWDKNIPTEYFQSIAAAFGYLLVSTSRTSRAHSGTWAFIWTANWTGPQTPR